MLTVLVIPVFILLLFLIPLLVVDIDELFFAPSYLEYVEATKECFLRVYILLRGVFLARAFEWVTDIESVLKFIS